MFHQSVLSSNPAFWSTFMTLLKGKPFGFEGDRPELCRPFLVQPLNDTSVKKCYLKPRQGGYSEISVREMLWFMNNMGHVNAAYTFHRPKLLEDFSKARIDAVLNECPHLKGKRVIKGADNVTFKAIGNGFLYLRARTGETIAEGIDIDILFNDEADRGNQKAPDSFNEAMSASRFGWRRDFGTPTVPNYGVSKFWERSDKKRWHNYCTACGDANFLTLDHIVQVSDKPLLEGRFDFRCEFCKAVGKINRLDGIWWPEIEDVKCEYSGYHQNQLSYPWMTADQVIFKKGDFPFPSMFYNYVMGEPYAGEDRLVQDSHLDACEDSGFKGASAPGRLTRFQNVAIGVDWGDQSWAVALMPYHDRFIVVDFMRTNTDDGDAQVAQIGDWAIRYRPRIMVCDAGYGKDRNKRLLTRFRNRVYSCYYPAHGTRITEDEWVEKKMRVSVDRTRALKTMAWAFRNGEALIPWYDDDKRELYRVYRKHLTNLISHRQLDEDTYEVSEDILSMGPDHFAHATSYALIGLRRYSGSSAEFF